MIKRSSEVPCRDRSALAERTLTPAASAARGSNAGSLSRLSMAVRDIACCAFDAVKSAALDPHEAELAQLREFDRGIELRWRRDAAVVLDDGLTSEILTRSRG